MKALMLAAVMALGGTGASALTFSQILSNGTILSVYPSSTGTLYQITYQYKIYQCEVRTRAICVSVPQVEFE